MRYQYDEYGWYVGSVDTDTVLPRTSSVAPPTDIPEGKQANYVGNVWEVMDYTPNPALPIIVSDTPSDPARWFIDLGPFYDRFGGAKIPVLTSADAGVKAIVADLSIRHWVDLERSDVLDGLNYVASKVSALTPALVYSIMTTPVTEEENLVLKKLYFNK